VTIAPNSALLSSTRVDEFADFLREGRSGIRALPADERRQLAPDPESDKGPTGERPSGGFLNDVDRFDAAFFSVSPKEAPYIDPQQRLALETAWEALEHAGIDPTSLRHGDTGVFMGVTTLDYIFESTDLESADVDAYLAPGLTHSAVSGRLSYFLGLRGPCMTVDTTCSPSLTATHLAVRALRGVTGTIASIVLEEAPPSPAAPEQPEPAVDERPGELLTLSAKSRKSLRRLAERHLDHLASNPDLAVADLCRSRQPLRRRWFTTSGADPNALYQVFLFPHAGGTASMYQAWAATLPSSMDVRTLQLPGRQERLDEKPFHDVTPLLEALQEAFEAELDGRPYLLFGHSFGGLLAYRLSVAAEDAGIPLPTLLAVSGWAPGLRSSEELEAVAGMSDDALLARVAELGLMPEGTTLDPATLSTIMPAMRGDFLVAGSVKNDGALVPCPVAAYCGTADPIVRPQDMAGWAELSTDFLGVTEFPGGHFYHFDHAAAVHHGLDRQLRRLATQV